MEDYPETPDGQGVYQEDKDHEQEGEAEEEANANSEVREESEGEDEADKENKSNNIKVLSAGVEKSASKRPIPAHEKEAAVVCVSSFS